MESQYKGGEFLVKKYSSDGQYIPEKMNEEQRLVRDSVRSFIRQEVVIRGSKLEEQPKLVEEAAALGLIGAHMPEKYGGQEFDTIINAIISEELGGGDASFSTTFGAHTGIGMLPILYFGTEQQKQSYLPGLCNGELKAAYCLTEPGSGSDALSAKTKAILNEAGTHYLLTGQKMWISNAGFADVFIVFAQVDGDKFTGFIVDRDTAGLTLGAEEQKMGIKGSSTRQIFFENAPVPVANVLGEIGKGHLIAFNVLNMGRFKLGVLVCGGSKHVSTLATTYANERHQFGVPISSFGAIQFKLSEMAIRTFVLESTVYRIANLIENWKNFELEKGTPYEKALLESAEEYAIECAIAKIYGSEVIDYVVDETVQIHGGNGYSEEFLPARIYRDTRINRIYEGTNEINRLLMINMLLRRVIKGELDMVGPAWEVQKELTGMPKMETPEGKYGAEVKALGEYKKVLLVVAGAAAKYQMDGKLDLKNEQEIILNIADIMIDVFNLESTLCRLQELLLAGDDALEEKEAIMKVYFHDAQDRIAKNAVDALSSFASGDELKIMLMGVKRFTKKEPVNVKVLRRKIAAKMIVDSGYFF
ncbi:MAG TPA: acyl-CoA dehydrogenase family protein [Saprospiraceae bacterium]|nr:acyl-CoA dehydrogenase family protein [Saprospiraceae bacterium]HQW55529.1 acyl-CoA dehydrogenase family protein [Saprospiraceae bacterium]